MTKEEANLKLYEEYNKSLRTWFLTFGIGVIALLVSNESLASKFSQAPSKTVTVLLFLFGCFNQVVIAFINKVCAWCMHNGDIQPSFKNGRIYKNAEKVYSWFWLDVTADVLTIVAFTIAIIMMVGIFI